MFIFPAERRVDDLELLVSSLEEERGRHTSRLLLLEEQNTELELQTSSLRAKLEHKSKQADGLQVELRDVNSETVTLERQVSCIYSHGRNDQTTMMFCESLSKHSIITIY